MRPPAALPLLFALAAVVPLAASAHPGATDAYGCHRCLRDDSVCEDWNLEPDQYHCHNDGQSKNDPLRDDLVERQNRFHGAAPVIFTRRATKPLSRRTDNVSRVGRSSSMSSVNSSSSAPSSTSSSLSAHRAAGDPRASAYAAMRGRYREIEIVLAEGSVTGNTVIDTHLSDILGIYRSWLDDFERYVDAAQRRTLTESEEESVLSVLRGLNRAVRLYRRVQLSVVR